jgi:hypothetical protein
MRGPHDGIVTTGGENYVAASAINLLNQSASSSANESACNIEITWFGFLNNGHSFFEGHPGGIHNSCVG